MKMSFNWFLNRIFDENVFEESSFLLRIMAAFIIWCAHYSNKREKIFGLFKKNHKIRIVAAAAIIRAKTVGFNCC
jgi:hypothetical protein